MTGAATHAGLSWVSIIRLGAVQMALGAIVVLATSTLNRVMVVEYAIAASVPAALVGWHYVVQLSRPVWGHGADRGGRRTPWIIAGMAILALGGVLAADASVMTAGQPVVGGALGLLAYSLIGVGVGMAGTSLLALLAAEVAPARRPAAAATTWIMMIVGFVITAGVVGALLEPFSPQRLVLVATGVASVAFLLAALAVTGVEPDRRLAAAAPDTAPPPPVRFREAIAEIWAEPASRRFSIFVFAAMVAYSAQDLILEPFAGLLFGYSPGASTQLAGVQHGGTLLGMILVGAVGALTRGRAGPMLRLFVVGGCVGSALALCGLAAAAMIGAPWPLAANVFGLGFFNGVFAVAAIGAMMTLAGAGRPGREGIRMGLWGGAQALAFALGGFVGAVALDIFRNVLGVDGAAFALVFGAEAALFLVSAGLALWVGAGLTPARGVRLPAIPTVEGFTPAAQLSERSA